MRAQISGKKPRAVARLAGLTLLVLALTTACGGGEQSADVQGDTADPIDVDIPDAAGCPAWQGDVTLDGSGGDRDVLLHCRVAGDVVVTGDDADDAVLALLRNVRRIDGSLFLGATLVTKLDALARLERIDGDLTLDDNRALLTTEGMGALQTIGHSLAVRRNDALKTLPLPALETLAHGVLIKDNLALLDVSGLSQITEVALTVRIEGNPRLVDLLGLGALVDAGSEGLVLADNSALVDLGGLAKLQRSGKALVVRDHVNMGAIKGFPELQAVEELRIEGNRGATDVNGFPKLHQVARVIIQGNQKLERIQGLGQLLSLEQLTVDGNAKLAKLTGFGNLASAGIFEVKANPGLTELALAKLQKTGTLRIHGNAALGSFAGLYPLKYIDTFSVCDNPNLPPAKVETFLKQLWGKPKTIDPCD